MSSFFPITGRFHYVTKGQVEIFLNGKRLEYDDQSLPDLYATTRDVDLNDGDFVVLRIMSRKVHRCLRIGFVSSDRRHALPVRICNLRIREGDDIHGIDADAIKDWHTWPTKIKPRPEQEQIWEGFNLPLDDSEWFWGPEKHKVYLLAFRVQTSMFQVAQPRSQRSPTAPSVSSDVRQFTGGKLEFFPDRVELCGVDICSGAKSVRQRKVLDLLGVRHSTGRGCNGKELALQAEIPKGNSAGLIRDIRNRIAKSLRLHKGIECGVRDVIASGSTGYCFSSRLTVHLGEEREQCHRLSELQAIGTVNGTVRSPDDGTVRGKRGDVAARRKRLRTLVQKEKLRVPELAEKLGSSERTVKRDLKALRNEIEFVGSPKSGSYRLKIGGKRLG